MLLFEDHQAHIRADLLDSANWLNLCLNPTTFMGRGLYMFGFEYFLLKLYTLS